MSKIKNYKEAQEEFEKEYDYIIYPKRIWIEALNEYGYQKKFG